VCAAVQLVDGLIIPSARHFDMTMRLVIVSIGRKKLPGARQGFIDQHGQFYTREEAWTIAHKNDQIRRELSCGEGVLYSENLY
jgi:hypothetical protein